MRCRLCHFTSCVSGMMGTSTTTTTTAVERGEDDALKSIEWLEESDTARRRRSRGRRWRVSQSVINGMFAHSAQNRHRRHRAVRVLMAILYVVDMKAYRIKKVHKSFAPFKDTPDKPL